MNVTGLKKQFFRVKQNLDQNLGRAERTEVLNDEELEIERRVELMKTICQNVLKKLQNCINSSNPSGGEVDKRLKKIPESGLSLSLIEHSVQLGSNTPSGQLFFLCGDAEGKLANERIHLEVDVETNVMKVLQDMLDVDIPSLQKLKKQLNSKILDMDACKARYTSLVKQSQAGGQVAGLQAKIDAAKDEMEDAIMKCEQYKDQLSTEMYTFVGREADLDRMLYDIASLCIDQNLPIKIQYAADALPQPPDLIQAQVSYHKRSLQLLDSLLPVLQECIDHSVKKPAFGQSLEENLSSSGSDIATVIEECVAVLCEGGMEEEGLFRIAGSASKIKKLKAAFNSNVHQGSVLSNIDDLDLHVVASVLKLYLRELPEPLMTFNLYSDFMGAVHKPADQRLQALYEVIHRLPKHNFINLRYLMKFLAKLSENSVVNKMSASNLAVVMGPNLMWAHGEQGPNMLTTGMQSTIVEMMIANADYLLPGDVNFNTLSRNSAIMSHPTFSNLHLETNSHHGAMQQTFNYDGTGNGDLGARSQTKSQSAESIPKTLSSYEQRLGTESLLLYMRSTASGGDGGGLESGAGSNSPSTLKRKKPPAPQPPSEKPVLMEKPGKGGEGLAVGLASTIGPMTSVSGGVPGNGGAHRERWSGDFSESSRPDRPPSPRVLERPKAPPPERPAAPGSRSNVTPTRVLEEQPRLYPNLSDNGGQGSGGGAGEKSHSRQQSLGGNKPPRPGPPPPPRPRESKGSEDEGGPRGHMRGGSKGSAHDVSYL